MEINTESHNWTICKVRDFGALSLKGNVFIKPHYSGLRDLFGKGGRKIVRAKSGELFQRNSVFSTTYKVTETIAACINSSQTKS